MKLTEKMQHFVISLAYKASVCDVITATDI